MELQSVIKSKFVAWIPAFLGVILFLDAFIFYASADHDVLIIFFPLLIIVAGMSVIWLIYFLYLLIFNREYLNKSILFSSIIGIVSIWPSIGIVATNMY